MEESYTYDAFGRMSSMTSDDGTVQNYTYDSNSNVTAYSMTKDGTVRDRVSYEYDNMNRLTMVENDDNMYVYYYDLNSNLKQIMDGTMSGVDTYIVYNKANLPTTYRVKYDGKSRNYAMSYYLTGQKYREEDSTNNTLKEYYYNSKGQLNMEQAQRDNNYTIGAEYSYDAGGNRIQKKEHYLETYSTDVTNYTYDANNRLTQTAVIRGIAIGGDDTAGEVTELTRYYYDDNGNTIAEQNKTYTSDGEQSSGMQLSGRASGNSFKLYTYDDFNRLRQYNDGSTEAKYAYNASNLRTSKTVNRKKTDFVWDGQNLASETTNGVTTVYDYDLTGIIASTVNGEVTKYVKDPHGNVVVTSRNGSIAGEYDYSAFGEQLTATDATNPFRYCGEYYDNENGLTYLRNRYYDSNTGRFLSEDPIKDGMNWYVYCDNSPVVFIDPTGKDYDKIISSLNTIYYNKSIMCEYSSNDPMFGEAYENIMYAKATIANEVEYYEDWGGIASALNSIVNGDSNSFDDIKNAISYVKNAKNAAKKSDTIDEVIYYSVSTLTITAAIRGGKVLASNSGKMVFNFASAPAKHMGEVGRYVPIQILQQAIRYGKATPDPQGSSATMYYIDLYKNGSKYVLEVLYDKASNTILHFLYK